MFENLWQCRLVHRIHTQLPISLRPAESLWTQGVSDTSQGTGDTSPWHLFPWPPLDAQVEERHLLRYRRMHMHVLVCMHVQFHTGTHTRTHTRTHTQTHTHTHTGIAEDAEHVVDLALKRSPPLTHRMVPRSVCGLQPPDGQVVFLGKGFFRNS